MCVITQDQVCVDGVTRVYLSESFGLRFNYKQVVTAAGIQSVNEPWMWGICNQYAASQLNHCSSTAVFTARVAGIQYWLGRMSVGVGLWEKGELGWGGFNIHWMHKP